MPGGDRMGPRGLGPVTGRAAGFCVGGEGPGWTSPMPGPGFGCGGARGRGGWGRGCGGGGGWRHRQVAGGLSEAAPDSRSERQRLEAQAAALQRQLDAIRGRLSERGDSPAAG